jgi:hypothetical protein
VDTVRQALHVPLDDVWEERLFALECQGLAYFSFDAPPVVRDADGTEHLMDGWKDRPREDFGSLSLYAAGVLRMADLYGRPYVRWHESKALVAHWQVVRADMAARLTAPYDQEKWSREWPERALMFKARCAQWEADERAEEAC